MTNFFPPGDDPNQNFDKLNQFLNTLFGGKSPRIRFGTKVMTWPGGAQATGGVNVAHGMGVTPVVVVALASDTGQWAAAQGKPVDATNFSLNLRTTDGTSPALGSTQTVFWVAVG